MMEERDDDRSPIEDDWPAIEEDIKEEQALHKDIDELEEQAEQLEAERVHRQEVLREEEAEEEADSKD